MTPRLRDIGSATDDDSFEDGLQYNGSEDEDGVNNNKRSNIPSLVCAFMASLTTGGTTYAFGLYGAALKRNLHLSQSQLDTISTSFFFAGLFSWIPGSVADRFGTRFSLSTGGCLGAIALLTYWVVAREFLVLPRAWLVPALSILGIMIFLSCALVTGSVFKIIMSTCGPGSKGSAVGVAKGYVGLGSGAYAVLFEAIRRQGTSDLDFLPMAAFFAVACATIPALLFLPKKKKGSSLGGDDANAPVFLDEATSLHFRTLMISLLAMATLIVGTSLFALSGNKNNSDGGNNNTYTGAEDFNEEIVLGEEFPTVPEEDAPADVPSGGPHYGLAVALVSIWLGPIIALFFLPRGEETHVHLHELIQANDDDDEDVINDQNEESMVESISSPSKMKESDNNDDCNQNEENLSHTGDSSNNNNMSNGNNSGLLVAGGGILSANDDDDDDDDSEDERNDAPGSRAQQPLVGQNFSLWQMLQTPSALLMLYTTVILVGAGTVETNNMGQMVESLGFPDSVTPASLALFSVAQAAGRVMTGALSESALNWSTRSCLIDNGVPRPFFLIVASLVSFVAHSVLSYASEEITFVIGAAMSGFAFGMVWPLMVLIVGEVFGTAHVGANYMFYDGFTSAMGTLFLSKLVAQTVYEDNVDPDDSNNPFTCLGMSCFHTTHMVVAVLSLTCTISSACMMYTSKHVYNSSSLHRT